MVNGKAPEHIVNYFSFTNIKGAAYSLIIGVVIYFVVVRLIMTRKSKKGGKTYINLPSVFSIEKYVYRPLMLTVLPFVGAFFARVAGSLVDWIILFFRKTIFNDPYRPVLAPTDNYFGKYSRRSSQRKGFTMSLAYSLMLAGIGVMATLFYLLFA